jgi:hypothetical protein
MFPAFYKMVLVLGHPDVLLGMNYVSQLLKLRVITSRLTPPSILEELSKDLLAVENLTKVKHIGYAGRPLQPKIGNDLAAIVPHLFSFIGATEYGWSTSYLEKTTNATLSTSTTILDTASMKSLQGTLNWSS